MVQSSILRGRRTLLFTAAVALFGAACAVRSHLSTLAERWHTTSSHHSRADRTSWELWTSLARSRSPSLVEPDSRTNSTRTQPQGYPYERAEPTAQSARLTASQQSPARKPGHRAAEPTLAAGGAVGARLAAGAAAQRNLTAPRTLRRGALAAKLADARAQSPCEVRKLLHWNVLDGGSRRLDGICAFLRGGAYDVVTLNELNGFDSAKLRAWGARCGLPHSQLLAKSAYHLGILSRHPLTVVKAETGSPWAHGLLCVRVLGLQLCVTHLNPHDSTKRTAEARRIVSGLPRREGFMLMGDLNTLSPLDESAHAAAGLLEQVGHGPYARQLSRKFLERGGTRIDYRPMETLLRGGLHDVGVDGGHSVPTKINADHMHFAMLRLDYCLVNAHLRERCGAGAHAPHAQLVRNGETDALSDHYPLEVRLEVQTADL